MKALFISGSRFSPTPPLSGISNGKESQISGQLWEALKLRPQASVLFPACFLLISSCVSQWKVASFSQKTLAFWNSLLCPRMLARTHPFSSKSRGSLECHPGYHGAERYRTLPRAITFSCIPSKYIENAKGKEEKRKKEKTKEKKTVWIIFHAMI